MHFLWKKGKRWFPANCVCLQKVDWHHCGRRVQKSLTNHRLVAKASFWKQNMNPFGVVEGRLVEGSDQIFRITTSIRNVCDIVTCIGFNWWRLETRAWDEFGALKRSQVVFVPEIQIRYTVYVNNEVAGKTNCWVKKKTLQPIIGPSLNPRNLERAKVKSTGATRAVKVISKDQYLWWRLATDPTNRPPFWAPVNHSIQTEPFSHVCWAQQLSSLF